MEVVHTYALPSILYAFAFGLSAGIGVAIGTVSILSVVYFLSREISSPPS